MTFHCPILQSVRLLATLSTVSLAQVYPTSDGRTFTPSDTAGNRKTLVTTRDLVHVGALVGITAGAVLFDRAIAVQERDHPSSFYRSLDELVLKNRLPWVLSPDVFAIPVGLFAVGRFTDAADFADVGIHTAESVGLAMAFAGGFKILLGRSQPVSVGDTLTMDFKLGGGFRTFARQSFPSGHAAVAFSMASSATAEARRRWPSAAPIVAAIFYGSATTVSVARLHDRHHWLSDIVFGAGLGTLTGLKVVEFMHAHPRNRVDAFLLAGRVMPNSEGGATLAFSFPAR